MKPQHRFLFPEGIKLTNSKGIHEGYQVIEHEKFQSILVNISVDRMNNVLSGLFLLIEDPLFLICEVPCTKYEESKLRLSETDPFHKQVYYLDNLNKAAMQNLMGTYGDLWINDGMTCFGFGSLGLTDEVFIERYKIINIMTTQPQKYISMLNQNLFQKEEKLRIAWDNITPDTPGNSYSTTRNGKDIYAVVDELQKQGLYLARTVPD